MGLTAASNIASLKIQRQLSQTTERLGKVYERLSSGLRINRAVDDPAGLAVADGLRRDSKIAAVAVRNANDGISLTTLADNALDNIGTILSRMAELAAQSANGIYSNAQRSALATEFLALGSEIQRIATTTTFNGRVLLSASQDVTLQVGLDNSTSARIGITAVLGTLESLGLASSGSSALSFSIIDTTSTAAQLAATNALSQISLAIDTVAARRGVIGAAESRLNTAVAYLQVARENYSAAESRIRDADVAQESADLVRLQVLQQAATAVLAQANQQPSRVLQLLQ